MACLLVIWSSSYKTPVHASEIGVAVDAYTAVIAGLAALGVGWAASMSDSDFNRLINKCNTTAVQSLLVGCTAAVVGGKTVYNLSKAYLTQLGNDFMTVYTGWQEASQLYSKFGSNSYGSGLNLTNEEVWSRLGFTNSIFPMQRYITSYYIEGSVSLSYDAATHTYTSSSFEWNNKTIYVTRQNWDFTGNEVPAGQWTQHFPDGGTDHYTFTFQPESNSILGYIFNYTSTAFSGYETDLISSHETPDYSRAPTGRWLGSTDGTMPSGAIDDGVVNTANKVFADGVSILNNSVPDVVGRVGDTVGTKNDAGEVVSVPVNVKDGVSTDVTKARDTSQEKTLGKDITTDADRDKDKTTNKDKDTTPPKSASVPDLTLPEVIFKEKFPFCLPWDLYTAFSNLVAPAQPPKWEIPFTVKSIDFTQNIVIDFSQFSILASILRWGLSVSFVIFLILITRKMIGQ